MADDWWKEAVIYQIYPASFKDSDGDGWGDLKGIISKVDYLKSLGVDIIWISPIFKSPQADMGYDIADYKLIDPKYGSNEDVDVLVAKLKDHGMKLMMDLVVNHTSNEHAWFLDSKSSRSAAKRDWYIWKDPKGFDDNGTPIPPNNWCQLLGPVNSAWNYEPETKQFYLGLFTAEQPDLNWENPDVRAAVHDVMRFWLEKGVCGYRMDVINLISKDQNFPDAEETMYDKDKGRMAKYHPGDKGYINGPRLHEYLQELKQNVLQPFNAVTVGEMPGVSDIGEIIKTVSQESGSLNMIFIFDHVILDNVPGQGRLALRPWKLQDFFESISKWQTIMLEHHGWNSIFIENHDVPRSISRYCDDSDEFRFESAKLIALMQLTLSGTLFIYQGQEIGIRNLPPTTDVSEFKDIESINFWKDTIRQNNSNPNDDRDALQKARHILDVKARDHARTPMQWDDSPHAGFCEESVTPWMYINPDFPHINTVAQINATTSSLDDNIRELPPWQFWHRGLQLRKQHADVFIHGGFEVLDADAPPAETGSEETTVLAYVRTASREGKGEKWIVLLNFSGREVGWSLPPNLPNKGGDLVIEKWVISTYTAGEPHKESLEEEEGGKVVVVLRPWEGVLGLCRS